MKLKFFQDAWYNGVLIAKAGEIKDISEEHGFAGRWLTRGAEIVEELNTPQVEGYDPGHRLPNVVDSQAGEKYDKVKEESEDALKVEDVVKVEEVVEEALEVSTENVDEEAIDALGAEVEIAIPEVKVENKKGKNSKGK